MSPVGMVNTVVGSALIDKVQNVPHTQVDTKQRQVESQAAREQAHQRESVKHSEDRDMVRLREREEEQQRRRKPKKELAPSEESEELEEEAEKPKHINITV